MIFNILLVLLVTCFATVTTPNTILARNNDVTIENAAQPDTSDDFSPEMPADDDADDDDEEELVSGEHTFSFDDGHDDDDDDKM